MNVPDLTPMGPTGNYPPPDRAILAGRAFNVAGEFANVAAGGERFISIGMDEGYMGVVWSVAIGISSDGVGNKAFIATQYIGGLTVDTSPALVGNMLSGGPDPAGFTGLTGADGTGLVKAYSFPYNFGVGNILNGIRVLNGTPITIGVVNDDNNAAAVMSISALMAVFRAAEVEDVII